MNQPYICCFGEILWDVLPTGKQPGGAPMNVGFHLKNLGMEVALLSRVGKDELGREIKSFVVDKKCSTQWLQEDHTYSTGKVLANVSNRSEVKYEILQPVAWDFIEATPEAFQVAEGAAVFVYGSLACRNEKSRSTLFSLLDKTKAIKICDINLRAPHLSKQLVDDLLTRADIAKVNKEELETIASWFGGKGTIEQLAQQVKKRFMLQKLIITLGADGALLLDDTGFHKSKVFPAKVKDTIGSGDSFLAGVIKNLLLGKTIEETLNYACALGALVAQHAGANPEIKEEEIFGLMSR